MGFENKINSSKTLQGVRATVKSFLEKVVDEMGYELNRVPSLVKDSRSVSIKDNVRVLGITLKCLLILT